MPLRTPVEPLLVTPLIPEVRAELLAVLESLSADEWNAETVCDGWTVRDVALHILGDDVGLLSNLRDHDGEYHVIEGWDGLVAFINTRNRVWVEALRRTSRRLLLDLLRVTGAQLFEMFQAIDPYSLGGPVGWAGDQPDPMWLHIAREFTEYWMHHQHICEAVGRSSLKEPRFIQPLLAAFVHALPRTFAPLAAPDATLVKFVITGEGGGAWHIVREGDRWVLYADTDLAPASVVSLDTDTAWRLFTKNRPVAELRQHVTISGDVSLGERVLATVAIIA